MQILRREMLWSPQLYWGLDDGDEARHPLSHMWFSSAVVGVAWAVAAGLPSMFLIAGPAQ
jgi:hypothetical protein